MHHDTTRVKAHTLNRTQNSMLIILLRNDDHTHTWGFRVNHLKIHEIDSIYTHTCTQAGYQTPRRTLSRTLTPIAPRTKRHQGSLLREAGPRSSLPLQGEEVVKSTAAGCAGRSGQVGMTPTASEGCWWAVFRLLLPVLTCNGFKAGRGGQLGRPIRQRCTVRRLVWWWDLPWRCQCWQPAAQHERAASGSSPHKDNQPYPLLSYIILS
jgi:hypothetical protein